MEWPTAMSLAESHVQHVLRVFGGRAVKIAESNLSRDKNKPKMRSLSGAKCRFYSLGGIFGLL